MLIDYLADIRGGNLCFFLDCEITGRSIKAEFVYWSPKQRGEIGLINVNGDRVVIDVPEFVWDLDREEFLYKAEYPIKEYYGNQDQD
jgi:hypothetical protein